MGRARGADGIKTMVCVEEHVFIGKQEEGRMTGRPMALRHSELQGMPTISVIRNDASSGSDFAFETAE